MDEEVVTCTPARLGSGLQDLGSRLLVAAVLWLRHLGPPSELTTEETPVQ